MDRRGRWCTALGCAAAAALAAGLWMFRQAGARQEGILRRQAWEAEGRAWARRAASLASCGDLYGLVRFAEELERTRGVLLSCAGSSGRYLYHPQAGRIGERIPEEDPVGILRPEPRWMFGEESASLILPAGDLSVRLDFPSPPRQAAKTLPLGETEQNRIGATLALVFSAAALGLAAAFQFGLW